MKISFHEDTKTTGGDTEKGTETGDDEEVTEVSSFLIIYFRPTHLIALALA